MNQIKEPGNPKDFGLEFNYAVWTANNYFTMCNVPWNSDYRDVAGFRTTEEFDSFIDSSPASTRVEIRGTRARLNMPVRVGMTLAKAMKYNYLRVKNGLQPVETGDEPQTFYYFIVGMREVAPETTELLLQLDVWASFSPLITGCRGFIERGHIGIANEKRMQNYGRDYLSIPEGFDTGSEYVGVAARSRAVMSPNQGFGGMSVIGVFASDPDAPAYKTVDGKQVPNYTSAKGAFFQGVMSGADVRYWRTGEGFTKWLADNSDTPWKTQSILAIMLVPFLEPYFPNHSFPGGNVGDPLKVPTMPPSEVGINSLYPNWRNELMQFLPERYRGLDKFKTAPYMLVELTTFSGTPVTMRPENWRDDHASLVARANFMPPNARLQVRPKNYNSNPTDNAPGQGDSFNTDDGGSFWDMFTQITNFPTVPIVNDGAILALSNQANSLAYAGKSADWAQQKALTGIQTSYDQASSALQLSSDQLLNQQQGAAAQNRIQQDAMRGQAVLGLVSGVGGGAGMGAFAGPAGAVAGGAGGLVSGIAATAQSALQMNTMNDSLRAQWDTQNAANSRQNEFGAYIRDSNADLARFAARGDYENTLAGIQAKIQDTMMTPASVVGQTGGELINLVNKTMGVSVRWKMLDLASMRAIGEHWLRFGYAVQQFAKLPTTFKVMSKFTYWKMSETYIGGAHIPENYRQALRGIFEKGFTIWDNPNDMNNPDFDIATNKPLSGVTLP